MIDWSRWGHEPLLLVVLIGLGVWGGVTWQRPRARWYWWAGLAAAYLAVGPPWEQAGRYYLFSVQMAEQLLLEYGAAGLLVAATAAEAGGAKRPVGGAGAIACGAAFVLGSAMFYLPRLHERLLQTESGMAIEHGLLLCAGACLWSPVAGRRALPYGLRLLYLLVIEVALSGVFSYLLMAEHPIYADYEIAPRLIPLLTGEEDQMLAGVMLSAVGSVVLVTALGVAFFAWAKEGETATTGRGRSTPAPR